MKNILLAPRHKALRAVAAVVAFAIIAGLAYFAVSLLGNPVSFALAKRTAKSYVATQYEGTDYEIDTVSYDFKTGGYYAHVKSPSLLDGHFTLHLDMLGRMSHDDYEYRLVRHGNVATRLYAEYRNLTDRVLRNPAFPYDCSIAYGDLEFDREADETPMPNALRQSELENHKIYDLRALGTTNGRLVLHVDTDTPTAEKAAEVLRAVKALMDSAGIGCCEVDLVLKYPPFEPGTHQRPEGELRLRHFSFADIDGEGLEERVEKCRLETLDYYARKNLEK